MALLNQRYREQNPAAPDTSPDHGDGRSSLRDEVVGDVRPKIMMLTGAVAVVLLIACANVASLLLSRALCGGARSPRAQRSAQAARNRRQLLTESIVLALVAGALGIGIGMAATRALATWGASQVPQGFPVDLDLRVLLFTLGISLVSGNRVRHLPGRAACPRLILNATLRAEGRSVRPRSLPCADEERCWSSARLRFRSCC